MRHDSESPRPPGRRKRFAANLTLFFYGAQLLTSCGPALTSSSGDEDGQPPAQARSALLDVPIELRSDTILDTAFPGTEAPGVTAFTADVTPSGTATVSLPLWVPPGRAGLQPSLSIVYDSNASDGLLGPGFNLAGLSQITLCPNSFARDNALHSVDFMPDEALDAKNRYSRAWCLDGVRLVPAGGSDARAFKTEHDTYASIRIPEGTTLHAPDTFEVRGRDGLIRTYGKGPGSREDALVKGIHSQYERGPNETIQTANNNTVRIAWALASIEDRFGNRMEVFYDQAPLGAPSGAWHRPSRIVYTQFRDASGVIEPGQREVTFDYEARTDVFTGYLAGVKVGRDFRLSRVNMKGPGFAPGASTLSQVLLRSYKLKYYLGTLSKRSLLTELRECDGKDICKTPVRFEWEQGSWDFEYPPAQSVSDAAAGAGLNAFGLGAGRQGLAYFVRSDKMAEDELDWTDPTSGMSTDFTVQLWRDTMRLMQFPDAASPSLVASDVTGGSIWYPYFNIEGTIWLDDLWDFFFGGNDPGDFCGQRHERNLYPIVTDWDGFGRSTVTPLSCKWDKSNFGQHPVPFYGHARAGDTEMKVVGSEPNSQYWLDVDGDARNERVWMGQHEIDLTADSDTTVTAKRRVVVDRTAQNRITKMSPVGYFQAARLGMRVVDLDGSGKMSMLGVGPNGNAFLDALTYREVSTTNVNEAELKVVPTSVRTPFTMPALFPSLYASTFDFVDVNGDGLRDAVALGVTSISDPAIKLRVQFNTGKGFTEVRETVMPSNIATMLLGAKTEHGDFDGDGRVDFAIFKNGSPVQLLLAGPQGDFTNYENLSIVPSGDNKEWAQVIDTNNDGLLDFTFRQGNNLRVARRIKATDVLKKVHGNIQLASYLGFSGLSYSFEYAPLSQGNPHGAVTPPEAFYARSYVETATKPWLRLASESMRVVSRMSLNSNDQQVRSWRYLYRDGLSDTRGLGWLGFGQRIVVDEVTGARTTTTYNNRHSVDSTLDRKASAPLAHFPQEETTEVALDANTRLQTKRTWTYALTPATHSTIWQQYARRVVETVREFKGGAETVVSERESLTELDDKGNPVYSTTLTHSADKTEQVKVVTTGRGFDSTTWLPTGVWTVSSAWQSCSRALEVGCTGPADAANTRTQQVTYGTKGQVESTELEPSRFEEVVTPTTSETYLKTRFERNERGLVQRVVQQGRETERAESVTYDTVDQTQVATSTDAGGATWRYLYHPGMGVLAQTADPNGVNTRYQYDGFGRPRVVTPLYMGPSVAPADQSIVRTYYEWNGPLPQHRTQVATDTGTVDETITRFDTLGRPVATQGARFDGQPVTSSVTYDVQGRVQKSEAPRTSTEQPTWESYEYDPLGRVTARRFGDGTTGPSGKLLERIAYTVPAPYSTQTVVTDAINQARKTLLDFRGLMVRSTEAVGTSKEATMTYGYGPFGRLEFTDDPQGHRSANFYDGFGRLERTVDPNAGTRTFLYNAFGEVKSDSDGPVGMPGLITTSYERDVLGRVRTATNEKESLSYLYDQGPGAIRRLSRATRTPTGNPAGIVITNHVYDDFGRETNTSQEVAGGTQVMSRQYDAYGRVSRLTYPVMFNGQPVSIGYSYTSRGDLSSIYQTNSITSYWSALARDSGGRLTQARYGSGVVRDFRYDTMGRLRFLDAKRSGTNVQRLAYEYTDNHNLSARHDLMVGATEKFTYDALDRLERWKVQQNCQTLDVQFQYDALGNLLSRSPVTGWEPTSTLNYTLGATGGPHAVKRAQFGADSLTYEYDHRGNQTASRDVSNNEVRTVTYTPFDLPESITQGGQTVRFDYDASGTRVRKQKSGGMEEVLYVGGLYQRRKQGLTTTHVLSIPSPEGIIGELSWDEGSSTESARYFLNDKQGSPDTVTNAAGAVVERIKFEPYGGRRDATNLLQASSASYSGAKRGFTGHEQDEELGLINMRGRIYDPRLMRFISADPVIADAGSVQAYNAYSYVLNNPIRYTDPSGFTPYGGTLVGQWGGSSGGGYVPGPNLVAESLLRHESAPGATPFLPSVDLRVPSVESLDDAKAQPDAHHTNDIGQSSGESKASLTSLMTTAAGKIGAAYDQFPCGLSLGCHVGRSLAKGQLDSMVAAATSYERYEPVSKLAAVSYAVNEFIPFVTAGESYLQTKSACGNGETGGCVVGAGKTAFYTLASGASIFSIIESGGGVASVLRAPVTKVRGVVDDVARAFGTRAPPPSGSFSMTKNAAGGEVWTSNGEIIQFHFAPHVNDALTKGDVHILSGAHGSRGGRITPAPNFLRDDKLRWRKNPNVKIHDITKMTPDEITNILRGEGTIVGGFCYSDICLAPFK
ncbi:hypothetical protein FJV41_01485 [Myxococcus llanfairpwllgwyngyllgogerychwyrndrobwllllantysiliogogogochensis]|uniref:Teneurin-like YD-shell domain-containing protein n=1 Tax=Myxococcus llanfairpwllgwyngyllgogerychwyrndrobwllllantysiliogogogochensis TaxID=2590453 RepID=A0A540X9D9_9BACT|nr:RHS repeat-associated core domain-containing protein [Myxococcus llanfairpwllgwyngyllgogerychwyrndrobwllllantysiliogogogochensis]TQF17842.1 hypothetical protein FJV41_01485 [Myxococcus llanfairpwllgwyngyllgogerychwyrndrobwllllantysiliogogogochensis]